MEMFKEMVKKFIKDEDGISAVEYALLLALIGGGIAAAAFSLGDQVTGNIEEATTNLQSTN
jgi:pilus assembly protein Flp/PilA